MEATRKLFSLAFHKSTHHHYHVVQVSSPRAVSLLLPNNFSSKLAIYLLCLIEKSNSIVLLFAIASIGSSFLFHSCEKLDVTFPNGSVYFIHPPSPHPISIGTRQAFPLFPESNKLDFHTVRYSKQYNLEFVKHFYYTTHHTSAQMILYFSPLACTSYPP